mmetsp:Transcript_9219/g.23282  ORF Transcript_9219/g.23282 Transcript_9219/m.23282 type:complete len:234 (-) Transcript_9219:568-1269(-)
MLPNRELQQRAAVPRLGRSLLGLKAQRDRLFPPMALATPGLVPASGASSMGFSSSTVLASSNSSSNSSSNKLQGLVPGSDTGTGPSTPRLPRWPRCFAPGPSRQSTHGRRLLRLEARPRMSPEIPREISAAPRLNRPGARSPSTGRPSAGGHFGRRTAPPRGLPLGLGLCRLVWFPTTCGAGAHAQSGGPSNTGAGSRRSPGVLGTPVYGSATRSLHYGGVGWVWLPPPPAGV